VYVTQSVLDALVNFDRLQVLVLQGMVQLLPSTTARRLMHAVSSLRQLQKLSLVWTEITNMSGDAILRALPASLTAVDLHLHADPSESSSSSLAHLVHLTSLRLWGIHVVPQAEDPRAGWDIVSEEENEEEEEEEGWASQEGEEEVEQQEQEGMEEGPSAAQSQQQQQQEQEPAGALKSLIFICDEESDIIWYAPASLEVVEVHYDPYNDVGLSHLAACPNLRQLCVCYTEDMPVATGVAAMTQLTRLRMQIDISAIEAQGSSRSSSRYGSYVDRELAALRQLRVLELSLPMFRASKPAGWLPEMHVLQELVLLVTPDECEVSQPKWGTRRRASSIVSVGCVSEDSWDCSDSDSDSGSSSTGSRVGGCDIDLGPAALFTNLKRLAVRLWSGWDVSIDEAVSSETREQAMQKLQQVTAGIAAALPGLEVTFGLDTYTCPAWTGEKEAHLDWGRPRA
jgi:hypothetical protein